jgi:hypothetical protein
MEECLVAMAHQWDADTFTHYMRDGTLSIRLHPSLLLLQTMVAAMPPLEHLNITGERPKALRSQTLQGSNERRM